MQAALTAAERGHSVVLCEQNDRLGGVLLCEEQVYFKRKLGLYIANQVRRIEKNPLIELRLNTVVDAQLLASEAPDTTVVAIGAQPVTPTFLPGWDREYVVAAEQAYIQPQALGKDVIIVGGGLVGCELGIFLDSLGHQVKILEMAGTIGFGDNVLQGQAVEVKIAQTGIDLRLNTKVTEIGGDFVLAENQDGTVSIPTQSVVYAVGYRPLAKEAEPLTKSAAEAFVIGDCVVPATIWSAVREAHYCGRSIGVFS
jgi:NADPH-dependent 2,4-dienoyl-CoA reductase/sulfur reductase-like enzyme